MSKSKRFGTIKQTAQAYPAFTEASLRWLIFNEEQNGFSACIRRIGSKIIIDFDDFEKWVENQSKPASTMEVNHA